MKKQGTVSAKRRELFALWSKEPSARYKQASGRLSTMRETRIAVSESKSPPNAAEVSRSAASSYSFSNVLDTQDEFKFVWM